MESRNVAPGFEPTPRPPSSRPEEKNTTTTAPSRIFPNAATTSQKGEGQQQQHQEQVPEHPEGKVARPHRCNDRLEDLIQALFEGNPRKNLPGPARLFYQCLQSNPGQEPSEPFFFLKIDPPAAVETDASRD